MDRLLFETVAEQSNDPLLVLSIGHIPIESYNNSAFFRYFGLRKGSLLDVFFNRKEIDSALNASLRAGTFRGKFLCNRIFEQKTLQLWIEVSIIAVKHKSECKCLCTFHIEQAWDICTSKTFPHFLWVCSVGGFVNYLSPSWLEFTGMKECDALGFGWMLAIHPDDRSQLKTTNEEQFTATVRYKRFDGVYRWFRLRACRVYDEKQITLKWVGTSTDIDDWKRAEEEKQRVQERLLDSERKFRRLFESNIICLFVGRLDNGRFTEANDAFLKVIKYTKEDLENGLTWMDVTPPGYEDADNAAMVQLFKKGYCDLYEKEYVTKEDKKLLDTRKINTK